MAIRYVKDFEFPAASGFTKSATPVTGQMYAKGGEAKAPKGKGVMLIIGVGSPKGPMKKAEGGYSDTDDYMSQLEKKSPIQSGTYMDRMTGAAKKEYDKFKANVQAFRKPTPKNKNPEKRTPGDVQGGGEPGDVPVKGYIPMHMQKALAARTPGNVPVKGYIPGTNVEASDIMDADERARLERGYKMGGKIQYEDGGKDTSVPVKDVKSGKVKQSKDADYYREMEQMKKPAFKKGGAMKHEDEAMDRKLVKQMIKPAALKKMGGGMAQEVQMAKSNAISKSLKGQKQTPMAKGGMKRKFADGGTVMAPQGSSPMREEPMVGVTPAPRREEPIVMAPHNPAHQRESDNRRQIMLRARDPRNNPANDMLLRQMTGGGGRGLAGAPVGGDFSNVPRVTGGPLPRPGLAGAPVGGDFSNVGGRGGAPVGGVSNFDQRLGKNRFNNIGGPGGGRPGVVPAGAGPYRPGVTPFPPTSAGYKSGGKVKSPLQSMGMSPRGMSLKQAKGVPAASRAPMIAPPAMGMNMGQTAPKMGSAGVGVNEGRPGKPNVGAIRAAMAKAATAANPDASPAMMKRGGKTSMSKC